MSGLGDMGGATDIAAAKAYAERWRVARMMVSDAPDSRCPELRRTGPVMAHEGAPPLRIAANRDPCPYCNARGDIGCRHQAPCEPVQPSKVIVAPNHMTGRGHRPVPIEDSFDGISDEITNRMMMREGSEMLARALLGKPSKPQLPVLKNREPGQDAPATILPLPVTQILNAVAASFKVTPEALRGKARFRELHIPRIVAIRLIRERLHPDGRPKYSFTMIGRYFQRDHSTILHALQSFEKYAGQEPEMREVYERLKDELA